MKKIVISIPVHQEFDVILEQLRNIKKFTQNTSVILHVSGDSHESLYNQLRDASTKEFVDFLFVNDQRIMTHSPHDAGFVTGLSTVHSTNFRYIKSKINFDVFAIDTSNDMFVRKGINEVFDKHDCGFCVLRSPIENHKDQDCWLDLLRKHQPLTMYEKGPQEGSFYPAEVFKKVSDIVLDGIGGRVAGEEGVIPCLAFNYCPELYNNLTPHYVYHVPHHLEVTTEDIHKVRNGEFHGKYSVKRVPRNMNNGCRIYVRELTKDD